MTGHPGEAIASEVDRYCAVPGQACGYMIGLREILRLRAKAQTQLAARFDLKDFNDSILQAGPVPLTVMEVAIDNYMASTS